MKGIIKRIFISLFLSLTGIFAGGISAQTYSGYLKATGEGLEGIDSLYVTITVPGSDRKVDLYGDLSVTPAARKTFSAEKPQYVGKGYYATPWMAGIKTNLVSDLLSIPYAGLEIQIARKLSLDLSGWYSRWNIFYPNEQTRIYGGAPELRWWVGNGKTMNKGHFVGLHGMAAWYTLEWRDEEGNKVIYQNGKDDRFDAGSTTPAWSCGVTYGYSLPLDKKGRLGFEFFIGLGYSSYQQKRIYSIPDGGSYFKHEVKSQIGITKVGVNLAYRFSLRRYKE